MRLSSIRLSAGLMLAVASIGTACAQTPTGDPRNSIDPALRIAPLEQERIRPPDNPNDPVAPIESGRSRYVISFVGMHPYNPATAVYLSIPEEFVGPDNGKQVSCFGLNIRTWFPEMTGPRNPLNRGRGDCAGWCDGEMLISIANGSGYSKTLPQRRAGMVDDNLAPSHAPSAFDYSEAGNFNGMRFVRALNLNRNFPDTDRDYFFEQDSKGEVVSLMECDVTAVSPSCHVFTTSDNDKALEINYVFSRVLLGKKDEIRRSVLGLVESFVRKPPR